VKAFRRWLRASAASGIVGSIPAIADAHVLSGSGGWTDEIGCLVPAFVLLLIVLLVGRDSKKSTEEKKR
jgi:hypothetical protein